jgi:hypothetical protein
MNLSREDSDLFFKLMWRLQFHVNRKLQILPHVQTIDDYIALPTEEKAKVREELWKNPQLIRTYVEEEGDQLSEAEREIVLSWKQSVAGRFQVYRFLKTYAVLIGNKEQVYAVLGLQDPIEDVLPAQPLPILVDTVLLPFKGRIIYDGLMGTYRIHFGKGVRSELSEVYMRAKQNDRIVTSLEPAVAKFPVVKETGKPNEDLLRAVDTVVSASERLRGGTVVQKAAFNLLRASAEAAEAAVKEGGGIDVLDEPLRRAQRALRQLLTVLDRAEQ